MNQFKDKMEVVLVCKICGNQYQRQVNLRKHMKAEHMPQKKGKTKSEETTVTTTVVMQKKVTKKK